VASREELICGASLEDDTGGRRRNSRAASLEELSQGGHVDSAPYGCRFSQEWVELNRDLAHTISAVGLRAIYLVG
jgi:hypothetical protein